MRHVGIAAALAVVTVVTSGCAAFTFSMWSQGKSPAPNENARTESVPQPGFTEQLSVVLRPSRPWVLRSPGSARSTRNVPAAPVPLDVGPPVLACTVSQMGGNIDYTAATHYGKLWKIATGVMFVAEAALAAGYLLTDAPDGNSNIPRRIGGGLLAVDALATAGLVFVPKRDVLITKPRSVTTLIRKDCPAGLVLEVDGQRVEVDGSGKLGPYGPALLDRLMTSPTAAIVVRFGEYAATIMPSSTQRCGWLRKRQRHAEAATVCATGRGYALQGPLSAILQVRPGTLSARPAATTR